MVIYVVSADSLKWTLEKLQLLILYCTFAFVVVVFNKFLEENVLTGLF